MAKQLLGYGKEPPEIPKESAWISAFMEQQRIQLKDFMRIMSMSGNNFGNPHGCNNSGDRGGESRVQARAPPTLKADITLSDFDSWELVWRDYVKVSGCDKEPREKELSVFRSYLLLEMVSVLTHALDPE